MINEKTRLEVEYLEMKKWLDKFEDDEKEEKSEKHKQFESLDVSIKLIRNTSNSNLNVSDSIVISLSIISKKLLDSSIFIDEKNLNIENWLSTWKIS
jgi:hypothetical protein